MVATTYTVAFIGVEARLIQVQCAFAPGMPSFQVTGLPDKAVSEARERVRAALHGMALALPSQKMIVNLSPADLPKEGSHFDLPIALAVLAALGVVPQDAAAGCLALGELSLAGDILPTIGALPAALTAAEEALTLACPESSGPEAAWVGATQVLAPRTLIQLINHLNGKEVIAPSEPGTVIDGTGHRDMRDVKGQSRAKRALEIAAAGRHHLMFVGPPGAGKSMMASRMPGILPPLDAAEALDTSMIHSLAGTLDKGGISKTRPFRDPHHTASMAALVGGGRGAKPGEISLAHNGVLFLDEMPEFNRAALETLRQPLETGQVMVARANAHVTYPCRFMLVGAANPCRCGAQAEPGRPCPGGPACSENYLGRISAPLMDRFDLRIEVPAVRPADLTAPEDGEPSAAIAARVADARQVQRTRYADDPTLHQNADAEGAWLDRVASPDAEGRAMLDTAAERFHMTARGYHRVLRVARTIADLAGDAQVAQPHVAEALSYRLAGRSGL
ncbi:MAG: YifB family Mg chelatase-like AAA ATPase [Pseudomonadota bacterium]